MTRFRLVHGPMTRRPYAGCLSADGREDVHYEAPAAVKTIRNDRFLDWFNASTESTRF